MDDLFRKAILSFTLLVWFGVNSKIDAATPSPSVTDKPTTAIAPKSPALVGQQPPAGTRVSDAAARRLRAAGIEPTRADFAAQVHSRLVHNLSGATASVVRSTPYISDSVRRRLGTLPKSRGPAPAAGTVPRSPYPLSQHLNAFWARLIDLVTYRPATYPVTMPWVYWLPVKEPDPAAHTGPYLASVRVAVPDCGIDQIHTAEIVRATDLSGGEYGSLLASNPGVDFSGWAFAQFFFLSDLGEFSLGAQAHNGNVTLSVDRASDTTTLPLAALVVQTSYPILVGSEPPFLVANSLGVGPTNSTFAQPTITRVNLGSDTIVGTDIIAMGLELGPGYTATATIVGAQSIADLGGDVSPNNGYRGAVVVTQPTGHRLQTVVQWHIGPGDSLQYSLRWTFTGPDGQRMLMNLPKKGACDS